MENFNENNGNKEIGTEIIETIEIIQNTKLKVKFYMLVSFTKKDLKNFFKSFFIKVEFISSENFTLNTMMEYTQYISLIDLIKDTYNKYSNTYNMYLLYVKKNNLEKENINHIKTISIIDKTSNIVFLQKKYNIKSI